MDARKLIIFGIAYLVVQFLFTTHLFVTFPEMAAYAASKDSMEKVIEQLTRIENKVDKIILGY